MVAVVLERTSTSPSEIFKPTLYVALSGKVWVAVKERVGPVWVAAGTVVEVPSPQLMMAERASLRPGSVADHV